jgi:hypothetical protein
MKSNSNIRPATIQPLGNGAYYYNYNVVERTETNPETGETKTVYDYETVKVWDKPTYKKLVKAVVREKLDETEEFSIINEYNASVIGVTTDSEAKTAAKQAYKEYLTFVAETKAMVKADVEAYGNGE